MDDRCDLSFGPPLKSAVSGERLDVSVSGSWTAANVQVLEPLVAAVVHEAAGRRLKIDMQALGEIDTFGACLLNRLICRRDLIGVDLLIASMPERVRGLLTAVDRAGATTIPPARKKADALRGDRSVGSRDVERRRRSRRVGRDARRAGRRVASGAARSAKAAADIADLSTRSCRPSGRADHISNHRPDRRDYRPARHFPFPEDSALATMRSIWSVFSYCAPQATPRRYRPQTARSRQLVLRSAR